MERVTDITIIGAGPYGLSIAAHLRGLGASFRIFGNPMHSWIAKMPKGMLLKSPGFASNLYDPDGAFTLRRYCAAHGIPYQDVDHPVPLETFCEYGIAFQKRFVPDLEDDHLIDLRQCECGFELRMASGNSVHTRNVVLAVGIDHFRRIPAPLSVLPRHLVSHSGDHDNLAKFEGREVAVIGGGASALDIAVLLHEAKASVLHIVRGRQIDIGTPWLSRRRTIWRRLREPISGIGPGWRSRLCVDFPWLYRHLPDHMRLHVARTHLGPSGGWFMRQRAAAVPLFLGYGLQWATATDSRVHLGFVHASGTKWGIDTDHVIAATGYELNVGRLPFLSPDIKRDLTTIGDSPRLSANFESSVPGLYFVGVMAAPSFGPVMRFAAGAEFTSRRLARHLAASQTKRKRSVAMAPALGIES